MSEIYRFPWGIKENAQVVILEYGSKSTPLIGSICRELGVCTQTMHPSQFGGYREGYVPRLVILSGGQDSVYDSDAMRIPVRLMDLHYHHATALFGICYGAQALAHALGGRVEKAAHPEIGITRLSLAHRHGSLGEYHGGDVVMNHGDEIVSLPFGWERWGSTERSTFALFKKGRMLGSLLSTNGRFARLPRFSVCIRKPSGVSPHPGLPIQSVCGRP